MISSLVWMWIGLIFTSLAASFFLLYILKFEKKYRENFSWSLIVMMSFVTGQYAHYWPNKGAMRVFLISVFFFGLHINTAYRSYLIKVLTNPRYSSQIDTVQEAMDAGLTFKVAENTVEYLEKKDAVSRTRQRRFIKIVYYFLSIYSQGLRVLATQS